MKTRPDGILILIYLLLMATGWVSIFFTTYQHVDFEINTSYGMQLIWVGSSVVLGIFIYIISKRFYFNFSAYIYAIFVFLILLVIFIGKEKSGAKSWLGIGRFGIQPSEIAKYATCLLLARYVSMRSVDLSYWKNALGAGMIVGIPILLILLQNDTGTALPLLFLVFALFREGLTPWVLIVGFAAILLFILLMFIVQWKILFALSLLFVLFLIYFVKKKWKKLGLFVIYLCSMLFVISVDTAYHNILQKHQRERIDVLFGKISDPQKLEYNVIQAKIAIGSGGVWGKASAKARKPNLILSPNNPPISFSAP